FVAETARRAGGVVYTLDYPFRRSPYYVRGATVHCLRNEPQHGIRRAFLWADLRHRIQQDHKGGPVDLIHALGAVEPGFLAARIGLELGIPSVVSLSVEQPAVQRGRFTTGLIPVRGWLRAASLRSAWVVTTGSSWHSRSLHTMAPGKLATIPLG